MQNDYVFLTPTWHGDLPYFARLRRSIERLDIDVEHYVVVDTEDLELFRSEVRGSRQVRLLTTADVLPKKAERQRASRRAAFNRMDPRRYLQPRPVPGWWAQMYVKLWFAAMYDESPYVCVDSDLIFLQPPGLTDFVIHNGSCPLYYREPKWVMEAAWFVRACTVLNIPRERLVLKSHTTTPQLFSPAVARGVCMELERCGHRPWYEVMRREGLAEYETYAAFAMHRWEGSPKIVPTYFEQSLVLTQWDSPEDAGALLEELSRDSRIRYFCVQSKLPEDDVAWKQIVADVTGEPI